MQLDSASAIRAFILAGKAFFTITSKRTGARYTYKVQKGKASNAPHFVSVLTGSDNESDYRFFGTIFNADLAQFRCSARNARVSADAPSVIAWQWFIRNLDGSALDSATFHHEGKCARCGRKLTVPSSIESGFGPECAQFASI